MEHASILPPNATPTERAVEAGVLALRNVETPTADVWNPATCPVGLLPWLAWALSVDDWDASWTEARKRDVLQSSVSIHRKKGTRSSITDAIAAFGFGDAVVVEGHGSFRYDDTRIYDGTEVYGTPSHWADYRIFMQRPVTVSQSIALRGILKNIEPARCNLAEIVFDEATNIYNGDINYNGAFTHGVT